MNTIITRQLLGAFIILFSSIVAYAQETESKGKIKLHISKEINGEKKTFEGEYENEAQMQADPNYQDFIESEDDFNFSFSDDQNIILDIQKLLDQTGFNFSFGNTPNQFQFSFDSSSVMDFQNLEEMAEEMRKLQGNMLFEFENGDLNWIFSDTTSEDFQNHIRALTDQGKSGNILMFKKIKITEVDGDEFGKKGLVKDSEALELTGFDHYPNPSNGEFNLRFKVPHQGELSVKVFDLNGKEVFSRYFNQFGGLYTEKIDLTSQEEGIYLLEIKLDKQRLTRKIVIE